MQQKSKFNAIKKKCADHKAEFISLNTLDLKGKLHSLTLPVYMFNEELMDHGVGFDASSYGFAKTERSDMTMIPDLDSMFMDPFSQKKTAVFMANIYLTNSEKSRFSQDVRFVAKKAEKLKDYR